MAPSLSVSVGVPPATVTASLRVSVSVTASPALRSPEPFVIPLPEAATDETAGATVFTVTVRAAEAALVLPEIVSVAVKT